MYKVISSLLLLMVVWGCDEVSSYEEHEKKSLKFKNMTLSYSHYTWDMPNEMEYSYNDFYEEPKNIELAKELCLWDNKANFYFRSPRHYKDEKDWKDFNFEYFKGKYKTCMFIKNGKDEDTNNAYLATLSYGTVDMMQEPDWSKHHYTVQHFFKQYKYISVKKHGNSRYTIQSVKYPKQ